MFDEGETQRGFGRAMFKDRNGHACSIQESSALDWGIGRNYSISICIER